MYAALVYSRIWGVMVYQKVSYRDKTFPQIQNTSTNPKHFHKSKTEKRKREKQRGLILTLKLAKIWAVAVLDFMIFEKRHTAANTFFGTVKTGQESSSDWKTYDSYCKKRFQKL